MVKGITYILNNSTEFQGIAGQNSAGTKYKAYPVVSPQPEIYPYSTVRVLSKIPFVCKGSRPVTFTYRYVVHSFHKNYDQVELLNNAVVNSLDGQSGTFNGVQFQYIRYVDSSDDISNNGGTEMLYLKATIFEAVVNESIGT